MSSSERFDCRDNNDRPGLQLILPSNNSATGARYNFYFPKHKGNGTYIPVSAFAPKPVPPTPKRQPAGSAMLGTVQH